MAVKIIIGLLASTGIAGAAYRKRSLSRSGSAAAIVLGTLLFALGSLKWYGLLLSFFISSSMLSQLKKVQKKEVEDLFAKGGQRDWLQVAANGGIGLAALLGMWAAGQEAGWFLFFIGTMAAVTADTWATEIGVLSHSKPIHILTWRRVERGTSGGISMLGMAATLAGGLFIGGCAMLFTWVGGQGWHFEEAAAGIIGGLLGSLADSLLGATVQVMYRCRVCGNKTEKTMHHQQATEKIYGYTWCTNDVVNLSASIIGGLAGSLIYIIGI
jgi:uncharacterized protein (TIGR00297 family)